MAGDAILELRGVSKRFGSHAAVTGLNLRVDRGEFFSLLGPSGCGKTTTLRMIAGFETPDEGEILLNGSRIDALPPYRRNVNTVFQNYALFPHLTVQGNVEFGLRRKGRSGIEAKVRMVLDQVRLPIKPRACRRSFPVANGNAWLWRGRWRWNRTYCCWTSLSPRSIRSFASRFVRN